QYDAVLPAVLGNVGDAQPDGVGGGANARYLAAQQNLSRIAWREAKDGFRQLRSSRAHQPCQAKDLAAPHLEVDIVHPGRSAPNAAQLEHGIAERDLALRENR